MTSIPENVLNYVKDCKRDYILGHQWSKTYGHQSCYYYRIHQQYHDSMRSFLKGNYERIQPRIPNCFVSILLQTALNILGCLNENLHKTVYSQLLHIWFHLSSIYIKNGTSEQFQSYIGILDALDIRDSDLEFCGALASASLDAIQGILFFLLSTNSVGRRVSSLIFQYHQKLV